MHRHAQSASARQIPLDLDPAAHLARESALRAAYVRLRLSARLSFEQVMSDPAYAISYERGLGIVVCRGLRVPVAVLWPQEKRYL